MSWKLWKDAGCSVSKSLMTSYDVVEVVVVVVDTDVDVVVVVVDLQFVSI